MQLRYLGDSHDYIKFSLLRHLHNELGYRIGVNWYLTDPETNRDGEQRHYLNKHEWECLDGALLNKLHRFRDLKYRTFENFEKELILPDNTIYYKSKVSSVEARPFWHQQALNELSHADLIFLDQDNGFEVKSMTRRTQNKYALYKEAFDYYESGKVVVGIQFASKVVPQIRVEEVRKKLIRSRNCAMNLPVIRGRVTPNILFFTIAPSSHSKSIEEALNSFATKSTIIRGVQKIEIIS